MVPSRRAMRPTDDTDGASLPERATVLFLAANPSDTTRLAVGEEYREVHNRLLAAVCHERVEVVYAPEVRVAELARTLQCYAPSVVHFSGHGDDEGALLLPDAAGRASPVSVEGLASLFAALSRDLPIRCVVLNACHSDALAAALAPYVDCVLGTAASLRDKTAVAFAGAFYEALGFGRDVSTAYQLACAQANLTLASPGELPTLHTREGVRPEAIRLLARPAEAHPEPPQEPAQFLDAIRDALTTLTPRADNRALSLSCQAIAKSQSGDTRVLGPGDAVGEGERVRLYVTATRDAYVTLLQLGVDGSLDVLVPREGEPEARLEATVETRLPGPRSSIVFEAPFGPEELVVVSSETPWAGAREALRTAVASSTSRARSREVVASFQRKATVADDDAPDAPTRGDAVVYRIALQSTPAAVTTAS
jgi:hypothetical protein